uniref:Insulinase n=1 Tax=Mimivirus LCMiAC02 TaxID=2506609 RepID=A0A481Z0T0_9VIRU|nr:MAG: insulinase [Mimivirus LCMiAC02]
MEILLISDPNTDIAAASMLVNVGHYYDPHEYLGLAHFLEHMLFMGTSKYKDENYYFKFLNDHGGSSNAHTTAEVTNYFFDVNTDNFAKSLEIFSRFFIDPLFKKDTIEKEINAVDAEHSKNISSDDWRTSRVLSTVSRKEHPFYKFSAGNKNTLDTESVRDAMIKFYNKYYSANLMKFAMIWNEPIDICENLVTKLFKDIKNNNTDKIVYNKQPFNTYNTQDNALCHCLLKIYPVSNIDKLDIHWQLPNIKKYFKHKPIEYISNLLGHEGDGSIYCVLKDKGLINSISVGFSVKDNSMYMLTMTIELTNLGYTYIPSIIDTIYQYIDIINKNGIKQWLYNEYKQINHIAFEHIDKFNPIDYVVALTTNMTEYPIQYVVNAPFIYNNFSDETFNIIKECLTYLQKKNSIVAIMSKKLKKYTTKKEKYFNALYLDTFNPITYNTGDNEFHYINSYSSLHLPTKNVYVPKNIPNDNIYPRHIVSRLQDYPRRLQDYPIKLNNKHIDAWYKKDNKFNKPKISITINIYNNKIFKNVTNLAIFILYINVFLHTNKSDMYYMNMADTLCNITLLEDSIQIYIDTYNDIVHNVVDKFINSFFSFTINKKNFDIIKEEYKKLLQNTVYNPPYILSSVYLKEKIYHKYYTYIEQLNVLNNLKYDQLYNVRNWCCHNNKKIKCLIYGNLDINTAYNILHKFKKFNLNRTLVTPFKYPNNIDGINYGEIELYMRNSYNSIENDSVIQLFYEIGHTKPLTPGRGTFSFSERADIPLALGRVFGKADIPLALGRVFGKADIQIKKYIMLLIINKLTNERFFNELRTNEQTGYIVKSIFNIMGNRILPLHGISFIIQSSKIEPYLLRKKIKSFVINTGKYIKELSQSEYDKYIFTIISEINRKDNNRVDEFNRYYDEIIRERYAFDIQTHYTNALKTLSKNELYDFYYKHFINKTTRKIRIVELYGKTSKLFLTKKN